MVLGTVAYVPSVLLALDAGDRVVVVVDTLVYLSVVALLLARGLPYRVRAVTALGLQYLLGAILLVVVGPLGVGPAWLFAFPVLTAVFGETVRRALDGEAKAA